MSRFSKIRFGSGLAVTDEGGGVITVSSSGGGGGGAPSGPAGGVLAGTYPNPTFAADMATQAELDTGLGSKVDRDAVEAATNRLVQVKLASGDTQPAFKIQGDGKLQWGPGGTTVPDTNLYRTSAQILRTDSHFRVAGNTVLNDAPGEGKIFVAGDGTIYFGATSDTTFYRSAAQNLRTNGALWAGNGVVVDANSGGNKLYFGGGLDANIYRAAANQIGMSTTVGNRAIEVGAPDSGGTGYRILRIAN